MAGFLDQPAMDILEDNQFQFHQVHIVESILSDTYIISFVFCFSWINRRDDMFNDDMYLVVSQ